jgi:hypothetical protein
VEEGTIGFQADGASSTVVRVRPPEEHEARFGAGEAAGDVRYRQLAGLDELNGLLDRVDALW